MITCEKTVRNNEKIHAAKLEILDFISFQGLKITHKIFIHDRFTTLFSIHMESIMGLVK